ncbi:hypothetical protein F4813DRAFT_369627 [Daldinia decipiens]|uniref:uncharacterized protein n=1 Tax=Daldinia decipiens TaxID=326647 RepID=UPI0020C34427|nr:uncharacterized protein F4813DRAFT_369627 [Daldinia decipiens]KAI1654856.1 hypothetical protein F4813DRAFT_369627 [Daldinia decipiens]
MSTYGSYIPPFRRGDSQATGAAPDTSESSTPPNHSSSYQPFNNGGSRGDMNSRGFRGGRDRGGHGRGRGRGRGTYGNSFSQGRNQQHQGQFDDVDFYDQRAIVKHFCDEEGVEAVSHQNSSTFHGSGEHPDQLSYMLLFTNANPRWPGDRIVFAKSKLTLLPEYSSKKAEYGDWPLPKQPEESQDFHATTNRIPTEEASQSTTQDNEVGQVTTAIESLSVTDEETARATTSPDASQTDEAPVAETSSSSSSRMKFSDVRNLPPEEQDRIVEERKQQRLKLQQIQAPSFPTIPPIDYAPSAHAPVAVFEERRSYDQGRSSPRFIFAGWYRIARINVLAPHSAELVRMQQQKWERRDRYGNVIPSKSRDVSAWNAALGIEWAVVKFEKIGDEEAPATPAIEKLPKPENTAEAAGRRKGDGEGEVEKDSKEDVGTKEDIGGKMGVASVVAGGSEEELPTENIYARESGKQPEAAKAEAGEGIQDGIQGQEKASILTKPGDT